MGSTSDRPRTALILAGAVAKGAFEAGALSVVASMREHLPIDTVVAASSGALNAALYAAGIRAGREQEAAEQLSTLWRKHATWFDVFRLSISDLVHLRGAGTHGRVLALMQEVAKAWYAEPQRHDVDLRIALTDLQGQLGSMGDEPATTFEHVVTFSGTDFDTPLAFERVARTALGSATLPVLYAPVDVPGVGPCLDGGIVNNTPVKHAIASGIDRIVVISAEPLVFSPQAKFHGPALLGELMEILINERLYRDLREALSRNELLSVLGELVTQGKLTAEGAQELRERLGYRMLDVVQIRPEKALEGTAVSAFSSESLRELYIEEGRQRATEVLQRVRARPAADS